MANTAAEPQSTGELTDEEKRQAEIKRAAHERQKQALELQRARILAQRTSAPVRRQALEAALAQINGELTALG